MPKAEWNGALLAQSDKCEKVEGNYYFPPDSLNMDYFEPSESTSVCSWKGTASYYSIKVDGQVNADAAWVYRTPFDAVKNITNYVAFWKGVTVE